MTAGFSRRGQSVQVKLRPNEAEALRSMAGEFISLVAPLRRLTGDDLADIVAAAFGDDWAAMAPPTDPALRRLFPNAYRNDRSASDEFRRYTQTDQAAAKIVAAETMADDIANDDDGWIVVPPDHTDAWLITLTNLRLVLAARLGLQEEADTARLARLAPTDPLAPTVAVYDWCSWLLESLVDCL